MLHSLIYTITPSPFSTLDGTGYMKLVIQIPEFWFWWINELATAATEMGDLKNMPKDAHRKQGEE